MLFPASLAYHIQKVVLFDPLLALYKFVFKQRNHSISAVEGKGADFKKGEKQSPRFSQSTRSIR